MISSKLKKNARVVIVSGLAFIAGSAAIVGNIRTLVDTAKNLFQEDPSTLVDTLERDLSYAKLPSERTSLALDFIKHISSKADMISGTKWNDVLFRREGNLLLLRFQSRIDELKSALVIFTTHSLKYRPVPLEHLDNSANNLPVVLENPYDDDVVRRIGDDEYAVSHHKTMGAGGGTGIAIDIFEVIPIKGDIAFGKFEYRSSEYLSGWNSFVTPDVEFRMWDRIDFPNGWPVIYLDGAAYGSNGEKITTAAKLNPMRFVWIGDTYLQDQGLIRDSANSWLTNLYGKFAKGKWVSKSAKLPNDSHQ